MGLVRFVIKIFLMWVEVVLILTLDNSRLMAGSCSMKNIDLKSFLIGFFMAATLLLAVGASKGTQDVRIVGIDKSFTDWDAIIVETE